MAEDPKVLRNHLSLVAKFSWLQEGLSSQLTPLVGEQGRVHWSLLQTWAPLEATEWWQAVVVSAGALD